MDSPIILLPLHTNRLFCRLRRFVLTFTHLNGAALHHDEAVVHPAGGQHDQRLRPRRPHPERDGGRAPRVRQRQGRVRRPVEGG